ncbi:MAG: SH3 domain-containing protein, partial [Methyloligellaceae bacterium]
LKADRVNVRKGPSTEHQVTWVYRRLGLPVEIIAESELWRRVRDAEGIDGWIFHSLLSGRRTALIMPWAKGKQSGPRDESAPIALFGRRSASGKVLAKLEPGVLIDINDCDGDWCLASIRDYHGWVQQDKLWGVYQGEAVK